MSNLDHIKIVEGCSKESAWTRPDSRVISQPGWHQVITPSSPIIAHNGIFETIVSEEELAQRIPDAVRTYAELKLPFRWIVGESFRPLSLADRLQSAGFEQLYELAGMIAGVDEIQRNADKNITVEVVSEDLVPLYVSLCAQGFGIPDSVLPNFRDDVRRSLKSDGGKVIYTIAYLGGEPAGAGALRLASRSAYLIGTSVVPQFRGKGIYRALVGWRADLAKQKGYDLVTVQAITTTSAPICRKVGLKEVCRMRSFQKNP